MRSCLGSTASFEVVADATDLRRRAAEGRHDVIVVDASLLDGGGGWLGMALAERESVGGGIPGLLVLGDGQTVDRAVAALGGRVVHLPARPGNGALSDALEELLDGDGSEGPGAVPPVSDDELLVTRSRSPLMAAVLAKIHSVASTDATVLLVGESGTGKGVLARAIHRLSRRWDDTFVAVHCGTLPDTLVESELFGHEQGAFTGATQAKPGKFELARGGTIFLDEVGTVTGAVQVKLLQVLQEGVFNRLGGVEPIRSEARVVAATNADLWEMCLRGTFREDLYFRLNVFPVAVPPLRDRLEDIPELAATFLGRLEKRYGRGVREVHPDAVALLRCHRWPGNVRELENCIERAYIMERRDTLTPASFRGLGAGVERAGGPTLELDPCRPIAEVRQRAIDTAERWYLQDLMRRHGGDKRRAARAAGVGVRQLHNLLTKHSLAVTADDEGSRVA